jgi:hypothetical protein
MLPLLLLILLLSWLVMLILLTEIVVDIDVESVVGNDRAVQLSVHRKQ